MDHGINLPTIDQVYDNGDIYSDEYEGWYSVSEERFITETEKDSGDFRDIKKLKEKNYFFKMSKYQQKLHNEAVEKEDAETVENEQAMEQWLRRIPDDPGGLMRRKFIYQYRQMPNQAEATEPW